MLPHKTKKATAATKSQSIFHAVRYDASIATFSAQRMPSFYMPIALEVVDAWFDGEKNLTCSMKWRVQRFETRTPRSIFECLVALSSGIVPNGLKFRVSCRPQYPNSFSFQLECNHPVNKSNLPIYRLELEPLRAHKNQPDAPGELSGLSIDRYVTHEHHFRDNVAPDRQMLNESSDKHARIVEDPPTNFDGAIAFLSVKLNIRNLTDIPRPRDQGVLL